MQDRQYVANSTVTQRVVQASSISSLNLKTPEGVKSVVAQQKPASYVEIERIPITKYYIDYEPVVSFQNLAYQRDYDEQHTTSLGVQVPVTKTMTDYQTIQITSFQQIQVPYTDYKEIEHKFDYVPKIRYEIVTQHIPQNQVEQIVEQHPFLQLKEIENGEVTQLLENVQQVKNVSKQETITQQIVQQVIEYEEVRSIKVLNESTVQMPVVEQPQTSQVVVQQSIHELQLNTPEGYSPVQQTKVVSHVNQSPVVVSHVNQSPKILQKSVSYGPQLIVQSPQASYFKAPQNLQKTVILQQVPQIPSIVNVQKASSGIYRTNYIL